MTKNEFMEMARLCGFWIDERSEAIICRFANGILERAAVECDSLKVRYKGMAEEEDKVLLKDGEGSDYWSHVSALAGAAYDIRALKITKGEGHE